MNEDRDTGIIKDEKEHDEKNHAGSSSRENPAASERLDLTGGATIGIDQNAAPAPGAKTKCRRFGEQMPMADQWQGYAVYHVRQGAGWYHGTSKLQS